MTMIAAATNPIIRWEWVVEEWDQIRAALVEHLVLTVLALGLGLLASAVLAALILRVRWLRTPITATTTIIYTLPSVALFALLAPTFGNLSRWTAVLPLAAYTLLVLVTNTVAGFLSVPQSVRDAADGMGMSSMRRVWTVEFPLAVPYIMTGIRIAAVSTVGLVTVAAIIGQGGLGGLIFSGLRRAFWTPMTVGAALSIILALAIDAVLLLIGRWLTPWQRRSRQRNGSVDGVPAQAAVPRDIGFFEWFFDAGTWTGDNGILASLIDTVILCAAATAVAALVAVPIAAVLAHYRRAEVVEYVARGSEPGRTDVRHRCAARALVAAPGVGVRALADLHRVVPARRRADLPEHLRRDPTGAGGIRRCRPSARLRRGVGARPCRARDWERRSSWRASASPRSRWSRPNRSGPSSEATVWADMFAMVSGRTTPRSSSAESCSSERLPASPV